MGFRFRKSFGAGPFRINLSKSGIGYSVGGKGFRYTKKAGGGTRTTASIPGTGISYVKDSKKDTKKTPFKAAPPTSSGSRSSGSGCLGPMTVNIILLLLVAFMGWAFLKMLPQPRSIWIALAIDLALPVPKLQAWITRTFQITTPWKILFAVVFFLFGGLVHNNIIHLIVIAALVISYLLWFKRSKNTGEDVEPSVPSAIEPQMPEDVSQKTKFHLPLPQQWKYIKYIILLVLVLILLLSRCGGSNAPEFEETVPIVPETTAAITETTVPETTETVIETTEAVTEPTETVIETTEPVIETTQATTEATTQPTEPTEEMVWIPTGGGTKYHSRASCSNMDNPSHVPMSQAIARGFTPCKRCY